MSALHAVDIIRKKRDGEALNPEEIRFIVEGAARETIPEEQLSAWLMAVFLRGLSLAELDTLTTSMRFSGDVLEHAGLGRATVDKHSTGGVGDKTSFLVAPIAAAAGLADPMISGRALGHTGGTLDKLESIPGYRTQLSLVEMRRVLDACGCSIVGQTKNLVPADRKLYALRDRTATVENPYLICASIMSKKLAASLDALVIDVKAGSGAFLRDESESAYLAALMVETGERAGTRTVAIQTDMSQPLGRFAGNWVEIQESLALLRNERDRLTEDCREVSLVLAGWMIYLGGQARSAEAGYRLAEEKLADGSALRIFREMVAAQGGDLAALDAGAAFHAPGFRRDFCAERGGYFSSADCTKIGWAVQRLGAGREHAGEPVEAHAGLAMQVKLGDRVEAGQPLATLFAQSEALFDEPEQLLREALMIGDEAVAPPPLIRQIISADNKNKFLETPPRP
ncbi:MAG TPA: thymidine phosphorylase [Acidobacteriaceae bacterium]|jgi:pyrimidine-nucleoside phosphorylase|nr:thymidine phosphorylase [Acidobacteriaceae bacterium]